MLTQSGVNREIHGSEIDQKLEEIRRRNAEAKVQAELDDLKRSRRPPLVPMDVFTGGVAPRSPGREPRSTAAEPRRRGGARPRALCGRLLLGAERAAPHRKSR